MSLKTQRDIPRTSSGPTRRAMSSRWFVDNSVDGYLRFFDMGVLLDKNNRLNFIRNAGLISKFMVRRGSSETSWNSPL